MKNKFLTIILSLVTFMFWGMENIESHAMTINQNQELYSSSENVVLNDENCYIEGASIRYNNLDKGGDIRYEFHIEKTIYDKLKNPQIFILAAPSEQTTKHEYKIESKYLFEKQKNEIWVKYGRVYFYNIPIKNYESDISVQVKVIADNIENGMFTSKELSRSVAYVANSALNDKTDKKTIEQMNQLKKSISNTMIRSFNIPSDKNYIITPGENNELWLENYNGEIGAVKLNMIGKNPEFTFNAVHDIENYKKYNSIVLKIYFTDGLNKVTSLNLGGNNQSIKPKDLKIYYNQWHDYEFDIKPFITLWEKNSDSVADAIKGVYSDAKIWCETENDKEIEIYIGDISVTDIPLITDKTALTEYVKTVKDYKKENFVKYGFTAERYFDEYNLVLIECNEVIKNENALQTEIDSALYKLKAVVEKLNSCILENGLFIPQKSTENKGNVFVSEEITGNFTLKYTVKIDYLNTSNLWIGHSINLQPVKNEDIQNENIYLGIGAAELQWINSGYPNGWMWYKDKTIANLYDTWSDRVFEYEKPATVKLIRNVTENNVSYHFEVEQEGKLLYKKNIVTDYKGAIKVLLGAEGVDLTLTNITNSTDVKMADKSELKACLEKANLYKKVNYTKYGFTAERYIDELELIKISSLEILNKIEATQTEVNSAVLNLKTVMEDLDACILENGLFIPQKSTENKGNVFVSEEITGNFTLKYTVKIDYLNTSNLWIGHSINLQPVKNEDIQNENIYLGIGAAELQWINSGYPNGWMWYKDKTIANLYDTWSDRVFEYGKTADIELTRTVTDGNVVYRFTVTQDKKVIYVKDIITTYKGAIKILIGAEGIDVTMTNISLLKN